MYENLEEKMLSRREIYDGKVLHVVCDDILLPNGEKATREFCLHVGAVCVIPVTDDGMVLMERQFRYPHGRVFYEIPAGKLDSPTEDPLFAAKRELKEETGAVAGKWTFLGRLDTSPALINEKIYMYMAEQLAFSERELDEDEFLEVERAPLAELVEMVMQGNISDAKTQIAILKAAKLKNIT